MTTIYPLTLPDRLLARRVITEAGCWEWTGNRRNGYGRVSVAGRLLSVHRVAASLWLDGFDYDSPLEVCHECDNPPCFNPGHLFLGTRLDNMRDAKAKGRIHASTDPRKTTHPRVRGCEVCGTEYAPHRDHRGRSKTCSAECLAELRSQQRAGVGHKLTAADAKDIRAALAAGASGRATAAAYGVSPATVSLIRNGKIWGPK